jgi:hypothetical protein
MSPIALFDATVVVLLLAGGLAWAGLRGGGLRKTKSLSFPCPRSGEAVRCDLVQDIRVGQYREVVRCTAFADPSRIECEQECRQLMNRGLPV